MIPQTFRNTSPVSKNPTCSMYCAPSTANINIPADSNAVKKPNFLSKKPIGTKANTFPMIMTRKLPDKNVSTNPKVSLENPCVSEAFPNNKQSRILK